MIRYTILILGFVAVPFIAFAQVRITEIMYDLGENASGSQSDAKREWVEIQNDGTDAVDLSDWRFNDGSNHTLAAPPENGGTGSLTLSPGTYAILASDAATFLSENPSVSGTVIDTVMSLNNTGDTLSLIDANSATENSVSYTSDLGASGDGNSLQLVNGAWAAGTPTPGAANTAGGTGDPPGNDTNTDNTSDQLDDTPSETETTEQTKKTPAPAPVKIDFYADAGGDRSGVTGATMYFTGRGYGLKGEPLQYAQYTWNFGDGSYEKGQRVPHTFMYPGTYRVMLDVSSDKYSTSDAVTVTVTDADIEIIYAGPDRIEIANRSEAELDLSLWRLWSDGRAFTFPKESILLPEHVGIFPSSVTRLIAHEPNSVSLRYPNDKLAVAYDKQSVPVAFEQKTYVPEVTPVSASPTGRKIAFASNDVGSLETPQSDPVRIDTATTDATTTLATSSELLTASAADADGSGSIYPWLLALISIISIGSLLALSRKNAPPQTVPVTSNVQTSKKEITADDITIID